MIRSLLYGYSNGLDLSVPFQIQMLFDRKVQVDLRSFDLVRYFEVIIKKDCLFRLHLAVQNHYPSVNEDLNLQLILKNGIHLGHHWIKYSYQLKLSSDRRIISSLLCSSWILPYERWVVCSLQSKKFSSIIPFEV